MEKRKAIGLKGYFTRTLLLFFLGIIVIFALAFIILLLGMQTGVLAPSNAGETEARAERTRQGQFGKFTNDLEPSFYEYIYFDKDGNILLSSLEGTALSQETLIYADDNITYGTGAYVFYEDGSRCLFTWRYGARFTSPTLQNILPNVELAMLIFSGVVSVLFFFLFVRGMGRKLGSNLALVETASEQIAGQNLDTPIITSSDINEFNHALASMDDMRSALKDSLVKQWESEQQRKQEIAALAHDIKTPLTIISGNAELLLEDTLSEEQTNLVGFIHNAGIRAQQYVGALQQVANMGLESEAMEKVAISTILNELHTVLSPLAQDKSVEIKYLYSKKLNDIEVSAPMLTRALINISENAILYTKSGGNITITVLQNAVETSFTIQDEGAGFSEAALQHAKEMFWQQDKSRTGSNNYGIGLSIAEKVARMHSGQLVLSNTSNGGCVKLSVKNYSEHNATV